MISRPIKIISTCLTLSISIVAILYAFSETSTVKRENFLRIFRDIITEKHITDIKYNSYYIAGGTKDNFYLGNNTGVLHILVYNVTTADTQHVRINIDVKNLKYRSSKTKIDSPYFFMTDGHIPYLLKGDIKDWRANKFMYDSVYFNRAVPLNAESFAIRTISSKNLESVLGKVANHKPHITLTPGLLEKQLDGVFCVDGMLLYNKTLREVMYVYYYRNEYFAMDTNMNLKYRAHTIDSNRFAKIQIDSIKSKNAIAKSGPSKIVNRAANTYGSWLFINSKVLSHNENMLVFTESSIIDVYNLIDRSYRYSFAIPDHEGEKLREFMILNDHLLALFDHYLICYKLKFEYDNDLDV